MVTYRHIDFTHYFTPLWRRAAALGCIVFFIASCSAEKRLQKLIKKHPELIKKDTVYIHDTVVTKEIQADTVFVSKHSVDTFYLEKEKLKIQVIKQRDTIRVKAEVKSDTIYLEKKVSVDRVIVKYDYINPLLNKLFNLSLLLLLLILLIKFGFHDKRN
ncbi:MAG: hypothetical protein OHK0036_11420 [Bacteroidia bacterium]